MAIVLPGQSVRYIPGEQEQMYDTARARDVRVAVSAESVFGTGNIIPRGRAEMTIDALREEEARKVKAGISPHPEVIQRHQMFAFPVACLVFAIIGVALGLHTRKEGKLEASPSALGDLRLLRHHDLRGKPDEGGAASGGVGAPGTEDCHRAGRSGRPVVPEPPFGAGLLDLISRLDPSPPARGIG